MGNTRRKKKKTNVEDGKDLPNTPKPPRTFIMERGRVGSLLNELITDLRHVMEPHTASRLKATRRNTLKDFVHVAGPLGVSHFMLISKTSEHVNLKIAKLPRGPTLTFHINHFSLAREVVSSASKPPTVNSSMFLTPPTLVLNNFSSDVADVTGLMATVLQNMYQTLNVQTVKLALLKRCVLWSYKKDTHSVEFRHYGLKVVPRGTSKSIRKIAQSKIPNLSKYEDISEFVLGGGGSESEGEEGEGEVTLAQDVPGRGNIKQQQSAVRLYELGPRLSLHLVKIEDGLCTGEVLYHDYIEKSTREVKTLRKRAKEEKRLKITRKKEQERNVKRKLTDKETKIQQERIRQGKVTTEDVEVNEGVSDDDDVEWYRKEVGVVPDPDLMIGTAKKRLSSRSSRVPVAKKRKFAARSTTFSKTSHRPHPSSKPHPSRKVYTGTVYRKKFKRTTST